MEKEATKAKILEIARELFYQRGFNGVSIREIAQKSGANISAINYHFGSKKDLFTKVIDESFQVFSDTMTKLTKEFSSVESLAEGMLAFSLENKELMRSCIRSVLIEHPDDTLDLKEFEALNAMDSLPPGGKNVAKFLHKKYGLPEDGKITWWFIRSFYFLVLHHALVCCFTTFKLIQQKSPELHSEKSYFEGVKIATKALLDHALKENQS